MQVKKRGRRVGRTVVVSVISADGERRSHRHQLGQPEDVGVSHADTTVRDPAWKEIGLVSSMDADVAPVRPVGKHGRSGARPERHGPVHRAREVGQPVPNVELAAWRGPGRPSDSHGRTKDRPPVSEKRGTEGVEVDHEVGRDGSVPAESGAADPACPGLAETSQTNADPQRACSVGAASEYEHDVRRALRRMRLDMLDDARVRSRPRPGCGRGAYDRPAGDVGRSSQCGRLARNESGLDGPRDKRSGRVARQAPEVSAALRPTLVGEQRQRYGQADRCWNHKEERDAVGPVRASPQEPRLVTQRTSASSAPSSWARAC
jgi:hypothetical protein